MEVDKTELQEYISEINRIDVLTELFKKGNFDFIAKREVNGVIVTHEKQREALKILTGKKYSEFLFGGGANGAKSWTGCSWIMFMAICYPGTRYFIARNELKDLTDSVLVTFRKVALEYGFTDFKFNAVKNFIELGNGSHINFIELKYKPSDTLFEDVGSTEYTCGWIEEVGQINETGAQVISKRAGRHYNKRYNIPKMVFYTCNPKINWAKTEFYDKWKAGTLESHKYFLPCLVKDNPFREDGSLEDLEQYKFTNEVLYKRLFLGDWDYEDSKDLLVKYEMTDMIFENNHLQEGTSYLTCDVARFGSDKAVIMVWKGWIVVEILSFDISKTTDIEHSIMLFRRKYNIPKNKCIGDADGVGGGVIDGAGIVGFINNSRPIKQKGKQENYQNLKTQCYYLLADKINEGGLWISAETSKDERKEIKEELNQIRSRNLNDRKLGLKNKKEVKQDIGRSPDYSDTLMMRVFFDLKPTKRKGILTRKRNSL